MIWQVRRTVVPLIAAANSNEVEVERSPVDAWTLAACSSIAFIAITAAMFGFGGVF